MNEIVVIGSVNIDMVVKSEKFPDVGETILGGKFNQFLGGKGANQAVAAVRLGGNVRFICKTGDDPFGKNCIQQFKKEGLDTDFILRDSEHSTGVALISVNAEGENKIVVAPGANASFEIDDINTFNQIFGDIDLILLQLEIPTETVEKIISRAKENNTNVILNPAPAQTLSDECFKELFLITPNETETKQLTGIKPNSKESSEMAANMLHQMGVKNVVITLGSKGAFVSTKDFKGLISSPDVTVKDTTAAGDVFNGAIAVALTNDYSWETAVSFACKAAALSVSKDGAQESAPNIEQYKAFEAGLEEVQSS